MIFGNVKASIWIIRFGMKGAYYVLQTIWVN